MAEDIDIEEHDILENPIIKRIFPDLSVLKQEVLEFDEGQTENSPISKETNKTTSCDKFNKFTGKVQGTYITGSSESSNYVYSISRKLILNSKCSKVIKQTQKDAKIVLHNIRPYLTRTNRFCELCLILFRNKKSLNEHKINSHPVLNVCTNQDSHIPISNKKNNIYSTCEESFYNNSNLRNEKNINCGNNTESTPQNQINEVNVMVKINDLQVTDNASSVETCFHCHMLFPTQQDLINHLYIVLNAKKVEFADNIEKKQDFNIPISKNNEILHITEDVSKSDELTEGNKEVSEINCLYSCPICSYYFNNEKFYKGHVIVKHKAMKNMQIDKVAFNPICKFCHLKYTDILSYNTHLRKSHKIEMLKQVNCVMPCNNIRAKKIHYTTVYKGTHVLKHPKQSTQNYKNGDNIKFIDDIKVMALKAILFKCSECHIHFLTSKAALKHYEHSEFMTNWECTNCHRVFKEKDASSHGKQHNCSSYFTVMTVFAQIQPKILYKCSMCEVHFNKENYFQHFSVCKFKQSKSSYCEICDILIDTKIENYHENDHNLNNFTPSDFQIVDSKKSFSENVKKNCLQIADIRKTCNVPDSIDIDLGNPTFINSINKCTEVISAKPNCSSVYVNRRPLRLNYCNVCKCYLSKIHPTNVHTQSRCINILKYICKYCGLMFSKNSRRCHRRQHHMSKSLKLQDFTFYDFWTNKIIKPPIPDFPKCCTCETRFITNIEVRKHLCKKDNYFRCHICKIYFSDSAYKLHMPFHRYVLNNKCNEPTIKIKSLNRSKTDKNALVVNPIFSKTDAIIPIYTCKNCNLSLSLYDEIIEHCHFHTNLDKVEISNVECSTCKLKFASSSYIKHLELHKDYDSEKFTRFSFDVLYFGSRNIKWLRHIYRSLSENVVNKLIDDSIYKYETRIKMKLLQEGPSNLTIYKCEKCQCIVNCNSTYTHTTTCPNFKIINCTFCDLSFACTITRNNHEKIHAVSNITLKSYKIVVFNREEDGCINRNISNIKKYFVVYECRNCHVLVQKHNYNHHICYLNDLKKCYMCGLLVSTANLNEHISKHKLIPSFNKNKIKVVLLGKYTKEKNISNKINHLVPTFNGIVCDYTFYKCVNCQVCVRDIRNSNQHSCLIDAAKSECLKCNLIFDEGKLKGHLKLHDTDPEFNKDTIMVEPFDNRIPSKISKLKKLLPIEEVKENKRIIGRQSTLLTKSLSKIRVKLYKCTCGLHYTQLPSLQEHMNKCSSKNKIKQSVQICSKCGLNFTSEVLFKHLLEHHGDKNVEFIYDIVEI